MITWEQYAKFGQAVWEMVVDRDQNGEEVELNDLLGIGADQGLWDGDKLQPE